MSPSLFSPRAGELCSLLSTAWQSHRNGDFTEAERLFEHAVSHDDTPDSRIEWAKSLRYRGQIELALELLSSAWEDSKAASCLQTQGAVCLELAALHREQGNTVLRHQFLQLALTAHQNSASPETDSVPEALLLETCFMLDDPEHGIWATDQFERLFMHSDDDFIKGSSAEALSNHAWKSGSREKSLQLAKLSCLHFCRAGHISAALQSSEVAAERLLAANRWSEGLATLAVAQRHAELLGLRTRVASHRKQRGRLGRALGLLNQQHLHN